MCVCSSEFCPSPKKKISFSLKNREKKHKRKTNDEQHILLDDDDVHGTEKCSTQYIYLF